MSAIAPPTDLNEDKNPISAQTAAKIQSNHPAPETAPSLNGIDLTETEPNAPAPAESRDQAVNQAVKTFDAERHRAIHIGLALKMLLAYVAAIVVGSFILVGIGIEIQSVELLIFALIALLSVVSGPILSFFSLH